MDPSKYNNNNAASPATPDLCYKYAVILQNWYYQYQMPAYTNYQPPVIQTPRPIYPARFVGPVSYGLPTFIDTANGNIYNSNGTVPGTSNEQNYYGNGNGYSEHIPDKNEPNINSETNQFDDIESYLQLPKDKFPNPISMDLNPNPIIDEFCKIPDIKKHTDWLLDLELGVRTQPSNRKIPLYSMKINNIICRNSPDLVYPGFAECDASFRNMLLSYFYTVLFNWRKGYALTYSDTSLDNFEKWLLLPMQVLGMRWS